MLAQGAGLRERKKAATRRALSQAALRLAIAQGLAEVTAEAVAAAVGVSPRTFHNYFGSKEEAVAAAVEARTRALADDLRARPADEPLWDAVTAVTLRRFASGYADVAETVAAQRLVLSTPALRAHHYQVSDATDRVLVEAVAARTGLDPDRDLYPRLVVAAVSSAALAAMQLWADGTSGAGSAADVLVDALAQLRAGLPEPPPAGPPDLPRPADRADSPDWPDPRSPDRRSR
ncbi:TetR family transcriptional regulator [Pilimelia terevasa]|uniref:TetR family transcriptional regulator n=1 Tax=Pilimelia terevasa TaxID=53372 RepID=A0A8J3BVK7_9ACTN|nr:TetR family transcriptional regulator [Pilimelia terevasa]